MYNLIIHHSTYICEMTSVLTYRYVLHKKNYAENVIDIISYDSSHIHRDRHNLLKYINVNTLCIKQMKREE